MGAGDLNPGVIGFGCPTTATCHSKDSPYGSWLLTKWLQCARLRNYASGLPRPLPLLSRGSVKEERQFRGSVHPTRYVQSSAPHQKLCYRLPRGTFLWERKRLAGILLA